MLAMLRASSIVQSHNITFDKRGPYAGYIRGDIFFTDDSQLHLREFVNTQAGTHRFTYVYHYQAANGARIFRYDDTPHFPALSSFPHHKHLADESDVISCAAPTLKQILAEIGAIIVR